MYHSPSYTEENYTEENQVTGEIFFIAIPSHLQRAREAPKGG